MNQAATALLVGASTEFLKRFPPFDGMEAAALDYLGRHATLAFHPRDSEVLTPAMGEPRYLYIIQRGRIRARQTEAEAIAGHAAPVMGAGACFPLGALAARTTTASSPAALHPLQQAWIDVQVPHCGYCQNGMMIQAADLLATTKRPTEAQIRTAMNGHLCRCGTYPRILTAIQKAAAVMAKGGK